MEYRTKDGTRVIVEGDKVQYGNGTMRKKIIGANFTNGVIRGGYLSSFGGSFSDELIGIESGIGDVVNAKIGDIKDAYELLKSKTTSDNSLDIFKLSHIVLETVDEYFGGFANVDSRMNYYCSEDFDESKDNKISNLKGTGAAMCVERAALAQNLLRTLGINSFFKTSGIVRDGHKECHSYNLIEFNDKYYIFDCSIPNVINNQISPLIGEIDKPSFTLLCCPMSDTGISITVSHYNPYHDRNVTVTYDSGRTTHIEINPISSQPPKHL